MEKKWIGEELDAVEVHRIGNLKIYLGHGLLYLHGLTLRILKKKIVGQMFKI